MKLFTLVVSLLLLQTLAVRAAALHEIAIKDIDGKDTSLKAYKGKVLLVVNVASKCGLTPQYKALEAVQQKYKGKGFTVLGFPCNQFGGQEPGSNAEIKEFCSSNYNVSFPLFDKLDVNGSKRHPLYVALAGESSPFPGDIKWNFGKFLVGTDGKIIKRFEPRTAPDAPEVTAAIEAALAAKQPAPPTPGGLIGNESEQLVKYGARNKIVGKVTSVQSDQIMSLVKFDVTTPAQMASVLTTESVQELGLKVGDTVQLVIKAIHVLPVKE